MSRKEERQDAAVGVLVVLGFAAAVALIASQVIAWFR